MLIDTHFHLDLMDNMQSLIQEFRTSDICVFAVGTTPKAYEREAQFCAGVENIKVGVGLHPQLVAERGREINLILNLIKESRFIGEVGLDFNSGFIKSKDQQVSCFRRIAGVCADEGGKILSIHSVRAAGAVIDELENAGTFLKNICIFHWFTGTASERKRAIEAGAWFSINPRMLRTKGGQETIKTVPSDRIILETDAPFTMKIESVVYLKSELEKIVTGISEIRDSDMRDRIEENSMKVLTY